MTKKQWYKFYFTKGENLMVFIMSLLLDILLTYKVTKAGLWEMWGFVLIAYIILNTGSIIITLRAKSEYQRIILKMDTTMKKYLILKGWHYSLHLPRLYFGKKKEFNIKVNFDKSCRYNLNTIDQLDVNKLFGISFGDPLQYSIRIGWAYNFETDKIDLYYYTHDDYGVDNRRIGVLGSVNLEEDIYLRLTITDNEFMVGLLSNKTWNWNDVSYKYPKFLVGYYLFPYFGGNRKAPKKMFIKMRIDK